MKFESSKFSGENRDLGLIKRFEGDRINPDDSFEDIYSSYNSDMERTEALEEIYTDNSNETQLGKVAEALVYSSLNRHEIAKYLQFRPASHYDDYFHGTDVLVEPKIGSVQAMAAVDITINQEDIKGVTRRSSSENQIVEARPVGIEAKLIRSKNYTDYLARYNPNDARNLSGWIESGGLHELETSKNKHLFKEAEKLFLMKYYTSPDTVSDPQKSGYIIGGPQTIISIDTAFINRALQGGAKEEEIISDLSVLEFMYCLNAEQEYLNTQLKNNESRNIFFDTHFTKIKAWSHILEREEMQSIVQNISNRNSKNQEFMQQLRYYADSFAKVFGN